MNPYKDKSHQVLIGSLFGDGSIFISKSCINPYYEEAHSIKQKDYVQMKKKLLPFNTKIRLKISKNKKTKKAYKVIGIYSGVHKELHYYHNLFYRNGKKVIVQKAIKQLDDLGLLIWYLDDGCYNYVGNTMCLATHSFTYKEHLLIQIWLKKVWKLQVSIYKQRKLFYLRFNNTDTKKLVRMFEKYLNIIPLNMYYKLGFDEKRREKQTKKRKIQQKEYIKNNKSKFNAYYKVWNKKYYWKHREKEITRATKYYWEHLEERKTYWGKKYQRYKTKKSEEMRE